MEHYELQKEIKMIFDNVEPAITGRIYKIITGANAEFTWEISHYCRLADEAECYTPSAPYGETERATERALLAYMKRFEEAVDWRKNTHF